MTVGTFLGSFFVLVSLCGLLFLLFHGWTELMRQLDRIEDLSRALYGKVVQMAVDLTALKAAVAKDTEVDQSAITLMTGLAAKIQELINASGNTVDPAELQAIVDALKTNQDALAAAVVQNTPAA